MHTSGTLYENGKVFQGLLSTFDLGVVILCESLENLHYTDRLYRKLRAGMGKVLSAFYE